MTRCASQWILWGLGCHRLEPAIPSTDSAGNTAGALVAANEDKENQHWGFESTEQENAYPRQDDYVPSY